MDKILALIELAAFIMFYLLSGVAVVKLALKQTFTVKKPFRLFRPIAFALILLFVMFIIFNLSLTSAQWIKLFIISFFASLFPLATLSLSSLVFAFPRFNNVCKLAAAGALIAMLSLTVNHSFYTIVPSMFVMAMLIAPFVEEFLKYLMILFLKSKGLRLGGLASIILASFAIGTGFAFIENMLYFTMFPLTLAIVFNRIYITATAHSIFVMLTLLGVEHFISQKKGFTAAFVFHSLFNFMAWFLTGIFAKEIIIGLACFVMLIALLGHVRKRF